MLVVVHGAANVRHAGVTLLPASAMAALAEGEADQARGTAGATALRVQACNLWYVRLVAVFFTLVAASGFTFVPSSSARGRSGTADLQLIAARGINATPVVAGETFSIFLSVFNNGHDPSS